MYETINQRIDVIAVFGTGFKDIKPSKIRWGNREYEIKKIGYVHRKRDGNKLMHIFSATDGAQFFELRFDPYDLSWFLQRVWDGNTN